MLLVPRSAPWMATFIDRAGRQDSDGFLTAASLRQTLGDFGRSLNQESVKVGIARAVAWPLCSAREHDLQSPSRFGTILSLGTWLWVDLLSKTPQQAAQPEPPVWPFYAFHQMEINSLPPSRSATFDGGNAATVSS